MGARLASIHSKAENRFVNDMAGFGSPLEKSQTTIGAKCFNGIWTWTDGSEFDYANWQDGRPIYKDTCGVTWADIPSYLNENTVEHFYWEDISCDKQTPTAVCKKLAFL
uniref:C-type lectin domain-containing protein n=1 Tax=Panagrolaimus superbus TaxID=310955 RepID=A0A914YT68_9BILA